MRISKEFSFQAAHRLPHVPQHHKCFNLHGHSYKVQIHVSGAADEKLGWICDFAQITAAFEPLRKRLDHAFLNDVVSNPTSENLAKWIWHNVAPELAGLCRIVVKETETSSCVYEGSSSSVDLGAELVAAISLLHEVHDRDAAKMDTHERIGAFLARHT